MLKLENHHFTIFIVMIHFGDDHQFILIQEYQLKYYLISKTNFTFLSSTSSHCNKITKFKYYQSQIDILLHVLH